MLSCYLSKKIAIPHGVILRCINWNKEDGYIACGGDLLPRNEQAPATPDGDENFALLKVIRLEGTGGPGPNQGGPQGSLSMNQTLDGHRDSVVVAAWNEPHKKLTTSDRTGLIIVWMVYGGAWVEEMINNRKISVVMDMKWTSDGTKICIAYEDGAVIVGSVDGSRLWGRELGLRLALVEWSPDGRLILFASPNGQVNVFDHAGEHLAKLPMACAQGLGTMFEVASMDWYPGNKGHPEPECASLCIALDVGRFQLMKNEMDDAPLVVDSGMTLKMAKWGPDGSVLAVAGHLQGGQLAVQFYSHRAQHLQTLRLPGSVLSGVSWDGSGTRVAVAVDSNVFFAGVRPRYHWCCLGPTVVYAYGRPDRPEHCVMFWDTKINERHLKYVRHLTALAGAGDHCVLVSKPEDPALNTVTLCNAIGSPLEARTLPIEPLHTCMTPTHFVMASRDAVYLWRYGDAVSKASVDLPGKLRALTMDAAAEDTVVECIWGVDDQAPAEPRPISGFLPPILVTPYPITAVTLNATHLVVARASGIAQMFRLLPSGGVAAEGEIILRPNPARISLSCDSSKLAVISSQAVLAIVEVAHPKGEGIGRALSGTLSGEAPAMVDKPAEPTFASFERRDVWDCRWAADNPNMFVVCEKNKLWVYRGMEAEEPQTSLSYVWAFEDLEVRSVDLDSIFLDPEQPDARAVHFLETGTLRECRHLLVGKQTKDAVSLAMRMAHPRLWALVAEHALSDLDFKTADLAFVKSGDFQGVQFVKYLRTLENDRMRQAEVAAFFKKFDEAEEMYVQMDRVDLAVELRMRMGEWFKVEKLVEAGHGDDTQLQLTRNRIGDFYAERQQWGKAAVYYTAARNPERLAECFAMLEDYESLVGLIPTVPEGAALLRELAERFLAVGMCDEAVQAYLKAGDVQKAVDCCVLLQKWDRALVLAHEHGLEQVGTLVDKYSAHLLSKGNRFEVVELYRKAGRHQEAVKVLTEMAKECADQRGLPVRVKQLYLLAALEYDRFQKQALGITDQALTQQLTGRAGPTALGAARSTNAARQTLAGLMTLDAVSLDASKDGAASPWRACQAFHFWLLAHRQLYGGQVDALRTALHLRAYEDVLGAREVYSFLALAAFYSQYYRWCSKAFIKLESLPTLDPDSRERLTELAVSIFASQPPQDKTDLRAEDLLKANVREDMCVATGRLLKGQPAVRCKVCKHQTLQAEVRARAHCPLCHHPFAPGALGAAGEGTSIGGRPGGSRVTGLGPARK